MIIIPSELKNALLEYSRRQKDTDAMYKRQLDCMNRTASGAYIAATKYELAAGRKLYKATDDFVDGIYDEEMSD